MPETTFGEAVLAEIDAQVAAGVTTASVAAAGATQDTANLLTNKVNTISGATGTAGVRLPPATVGLIYYVTNPHASNSVIVYPATGEAIVSSAFGAPGTNMPVNVGGYGIGIFVCAVAGTWQAILGVTYAGNNSDFSVGTGAIILGKLQLKSLTQVTATADGLTTGLIPYGTSYARIISANSAHKISLPAGEVGHQLRLQMGSTACKLIAVTAGDKANNVIIGATNQLTLLANATYLCEYVDGNEWRITGHLQNGAPIAVNTAALTTITIADAEGTPDYALQAVTVTAPYGLATQQEAITLMYVIKNLQVRMAELETALNLTPVAI